MNIFKLKEEKKNHSILLHILITKSIKFIHHYLPKYTSHYLFLFNILYLFATKLK